MSAKERKNITRAVFAVSGIDCVTCGLAIRKKVKKMGGVEEVEVSPMLNKVFIDYDESKVSISEIRKAIAKTGYASYLTRREAGGDGGRAMADPNRKPNPISRLFKH
jgi:P-type Cu+ transporter